MKEYRLKCIYPSLPKDWKVDMIVGLGDRNCGYSPCAGNYRDIKLHNPEVESNPEFWEEVKEKDFEILSFTCLNKDTGVPFGEIRILGVNTVCSAEQYLNVGSSVKSGDWAIHSVKRLYDGQVFKIGDKCDISCQDKKIRVIDKFHLYEDELSIHLKNFDNPCLLSFVNLQNIKHWKQSLFTALDGVEIFAGDLVHCIRWSNYNSITSMHIPISDPYLFENNIPIFAKKENAEEFIKQNEKRFSLNDIKKALNYYRPQTPTGYTHINEFLSRLNKQ